MCNHFFSCEEKENLDPLDENSIEQQTIPKHIIQKLEKAGFYTNVGLYGIDDGYVVENDIFLSEEEIDELAKENTSQAKHYRTSNLVSGTRTVKVYVDPALGSFVRGALDEAIRRYNALNLRLTLRRTSSATSNDIRIVPASNAALSGSFAIAGFPRNGRPHNLIRMNTSFYGGTNRLGNTASVIAHEIGHCIGFRHTDYANRGFSCGSGGNEGPAGVGAIHIPGTPTTHAVANSWMLACIGRNVNRPFIASDKTALQNLYRKGTPAAVSFYRFYNSSRVNHFYTANRNEGNNAVGYRYEGIACKIYRTKVSGTIALYRFYNAGAVNHFYTRNRNEGNNAAGYRYGGIAGYVYPSSGANRIPLYRYYNSSRVNHFYTTNRNEGNNAAGYRYAGIAGYVPK